MSLATPSGIAKVYVWLLAELTTECRLPGMMIRRKLQSVTDRPHKDGEPKPGKDSRGRFTANNKYGHGNSYAHEQFRIQSAIRAQMSDLQLKEFVRSWIKKARDGKGIYLISLLERWAGKPADWATEERIATLEAQIMDLSKEQPKAI